MKVKRKICRKGFILGYWKGEKIALMPKYHPNNNPDHYVIEAVDFEENEEVPRLIDPAEYNLSELKEICEYNDVPFYWVTGIGSGDRKDIYIQKTDKLKDVIDLFIAYNSAGSTSAQYRRFFDDLVKNNIINPTWTISDYKENESAVSDKAFKLPIIEKKEEEARYKNRFMLISFAEFLENPTYFEIKKTTGHYCSKRRKDFLTDEEAEVFFPALKEINPIFELIGQILRYYNREIFQDPSEGFIVPIESLLKLQKHNVGKDNVLNIFCNKMSGSLLFGLYLEDELFQRLFKLSQNTDLFVFRNKNGGYTDSGQLRRAFRKASKACGLRNISPSQLC